MSSMVPKQLPRPGLGTWQNELRQQCVDSVLTALDLGYRHIDTAQAYNNEHFVGEALAQTSVDRDEIFIATKINRGNLAYDDVIRTTEESMKRLGVDRLDLLYIHWPVNIGLDTKLQPGYDPAEIKYPVDETWAAFNELYDDGKVDHLGVANFSIELIDEAVDVSDAPLSAVQVETHPLYPQREMMEYTKQNDLWHVAYSPLARARVFDVPIIQEIAEKHEVSPAIVSLSWLLHNEHVVPIPMADIEMHLRENLSAVGFELEQADLDRIESIDEMQKMVDPIHGGWHW